MKEVVPAALDGERLDRVVALLTGCSRAEASNLVASGKALVDGEPAAGKLKLRQGQVVELRREPAERAATPTADPAVEVPVVFEDADVVVIDKPAGLVVHPGAGHDRGTLVHGLLARYPEMARVGDAERPGIVHRLDRGTSGLLVVARTPLAYASLVEQLSGRTASRTYRGVVWGHPDPPRGVVDAPIGRSPREPTRMAVVAGGREARTRYAVVHELMEPLAAAVVTCKLETGRTHQIRVHMAAIGHPIVGDGAYGGVRDGVTTARPMLHAEQLAFDHPRTGERLTFTAPVPDDMTAVLARFH